MKIYRLVTLTAAVLITVFLASFLADQKPGDPQERPVAAAASIPRG
jgi:hypothetical protein